MNTKKNTITRAFRRARPWLHNPLPQLTPESLSRHLDAFEAGYLREAAIIWQYLEQRDDLLRAVISKRKKSVARHGWTVLTKPNLSPSESRQAPAHARALEYFYENLQCENAMDDSERGGFKLLTRQMMDAVGKKYAVHEIVWKHAPAGQGSIGGTNRGLVTARFRFVPLACFENTTGQLRFLEHETATEGRALEPGSWMITTGDGLMIASSTAWMLKKLSLNDWILFSQRNGRPGLRGISTAARDSEQWQELEQALQDLLEGDSVVHSATDDIKVIDLGAGGSIPFPRLVDRIDRMLAALWRGADLSTISRDRGYGASLQEKEACLLEEDDAEMLTETLNRYVDEWVIRHVFGNEVRPLAHVKVLVSPKECTSHDLQVDEFLLRHGAPLSLESTLHRYGRTAARTPGDLMPAGSSIRPARPRAKSNAPGVEVTTGRVPVLENAPGGVVSRNGSGMAGAFLENQFSMAQESWIQLSPYGDFPHARGLQRVDRAAAEEMVAGFHSFLGRLGRLFGGVPLYIGHPDLPESSDTIDRKAYGWITDLQAREDGLYGFAKWSESGLELLRNAHFKFLSPYWEAREAGRENGRRIYRPFSLISVGLTNQPNLPVKPLANEEEMACAGQNENHPPLPFAMHTRSVTEQLGRRKLDWIRLHNRRDRIQELVLAKTKSGLTYDEAWESVKREHPAWFQS